MVQLMVKIASWGAMLAAIAALAACKESPQHRLVSAALHGDVAGVRTALTAKVSVNAYDRGETALLMASEFCHPDVVGVLIAAGADVNARSSDSRHRGLDGETPLIEAAGADQGGCPDAVRALIAAGANVNAHQSDGSTALDAAADEGGLEVAQLLVAAGADVNGASSGNTPLYLTTGTSPAGASPSGRAAVAQLLRAHGGHV